MKLLHPVFDSVSVEVETKAEAKKWVKQGWALVEQVEQVEQVEEK